MRYFGIIILLILSFSCRNTERHRTEKYIRESGANSAELWKIYDYYKKTGDKEKISAAGFLIENTFKKNSISDNGLSDVYNNYIDSIESASGSAVSAGQGLTTGSIPIDKRFHKISRIKDMDVLNADSIIKATDFAFAVWKKARWSSTYSFEDFKEYVLPYRVHNEPLQYYWRQDAHDRYSKYIHYDTVADPKAAALRVSKNIVFEDLATVFYDARPQSYSSNVLNRRGKCIDRTIFTAMILRSLGIPAAMDIIPYWGNSNNGHTLNALVLPNNLSIGFSDYEDINKGVLLSEKIPKIYRQTFGIQKNTALYQHKNTEFIPEVFTGFDYLDVSSQYDLNLADAVVPVLSQDNQSKVAYLAVFSCKEWIPVAWAGIQKDQAKFINMGTGYNGGQKPEDKGEGIKDGILYLPVCFNKEESVPVNDPFILTRDGNKRILKPDVSAKEAVTVKRKYPRKERMIKYAGRMAEGEFEAANQADFSDAQSLHYIYNTPLSRMQEIEITDDKQYKYLRYKKSKGGISIAELAFYDAKGQKLEGKVIADKFIKDEPDIKKVFDGKPLTFFDLQELNDCWVGIALSRPAKIGKIAFSPRSDDNDLSPGDHYELFYWDNQWVSLGAQVAGGYELLFRDVPKNALLWLRNLTHGIEERPFTYEGGKQIWW